MGKNRLMRETGADRVFDIINYAFVIIALVIITYPLIFVLSASFSSPMALLSGRVWLWPVEFSLNGYKAVIEYKEVWTGYLNSIIYMVAGTSLSVVLTVAAAYPLSRKDFAARKTITLIFTFTILFSGGMIPTYLNVQNFGLLDTRWAMLIPSAINMFNVFVTISFFKSTIPDELLNSARIDGCNNFRFLISIVIPLSGAIIGVISLFYAVDQWNSYFDALLYLTDRQKFPLQLILRDILMLNQQMFSVSAEVSDDTNRLFLAELLKYSLIVFATLPLLIIYPFIQKYFVKGVMIGSLKG